MSANTPTYHNEYDACGYCWPQECDSVARSADTTEVFANISLHRLTQDHTIENI